MAIPAPIPDFSQPSLVLFPPAIPLTAAQLPELVDDFFSWLEHEWQLPVASRTPAPPPLVFPARLVEKNMYTLHDLCQLWGWKRRKMQRELDQLRISAAGTCPISWTIPHRGGRWNHYRGRTLLAAVQIWEWQLLNAYVDAQWQRFFKAPCQTCYHCRQCTRPEHKEHWIHCVSNFGRRHNRSYFLSLLDGIRTWGSVAAWWQHEYAYIQAAPSPKPPLDSGLIFLYLLDRHHLALSWEEMTAIFPLSGIAPDDYARLWRLRRPEEYETFLQILADHNRAESGYRRTLIALSMLLLQYGLQGVSELSHPLTTEEIEAAVRQRYLLTEHIYADVYFPYPLNSDIRLGHLLVDTMRMFIWKHAHADSLASGRTRETTPFNWKLNHLRAIEQALCSHVWHGVRGILVPRPETKGQLLNPYRHQYDSECAGIALSQLPPFVNNLLTTFIRRRHLEQHISQSTLEDALSAVLQLLHFVQQQGGLETMHTWDRGRCKQIFETFDEQECRHLALGTRYEVFAQLLCWFDTLAQLELPVPPGYTVLHAYAGYQRQQRKKRSVPPEVLLDRVFRDGVCQLPDPYIRLALTIQYYCGTRIQETLDMHLFSMWEDEEGRAYLTIPIGKGMEERLFPIVPVGMEPLVTLMDEIVRSQLRPGYIAHARVLANHHYLATDPERATAWYYLFDRFTDHGQTRHKAVLSYGRILDAMREVVLLAAYTDPRDLFEEGTYHSQCQRRVKKGKACKYLALRAGIMTCPVCNTKLQGRRGEVCQHKLKFDFACTGEARAGEWFCSVCNAPLAQPRSITSHLFRHNSVTRASRRGMPLAHNMLLHGHRTVVMHMRYNHPELKEIYEGVQGIMGAMRLREAQLLAQFAPGQVVVDGIAQTPPLEQYLGLTLRRLWRRETAKVWGGFVANALSEEGIHSPVRGGVEIVITEETYAHTVAQYRYDALGLAISEVALEQQTDGKYHAQVPPYFDRRVIERLVTQHLALQGQLPGELAIRLMQSEIKRQRRFLEELAAMLQPWWQHYGSIDHLVMALTPTGIDPFYRLEENDAS